MRLVQRRQPRLETLAADLVGLDDDLHALGGCEVARGLKRVAARRLEVDLVGLATDKDFAFGAAAIDLDRLLIGVKHIESELVAVGDQLPVLFSLAGIDEMAALLPLGPLAVAVGESRN